MTPANPTLRPIGGFIGLEPASPPPPRPADFGAPHVLKFWNARAALAHLLRAREVRRVWLPAYICLAPAEAAAEDGCEVAYYGVGGDLAPDVEQLSAGLADGDAVLGIDYFGTPSLGLAALARSFPRVIWIQDRAQALWPDPAPWGGHLLYSPRKMVGAPDGGVLASLASGLPEPDWVPDRDLSRLEPTRLRAADPLGVARETWFPAYRAAEAAMTCEPRPISQVSAEILDRLDVPAMAAQRRRNAARLLGQVGDAALFGADRLLAGAPLGVPVLTHDAATVAVRMAEAGVYCARHWADLPSPAADFTAEHALSRRLLTLPCDHRYADADMDRVAETFQRAR